MFVLAGPSVTTAPITSTPDFLVLELPSRCVGGIVLALNCAAMLKAFFLYPMQFMPLQLFRIRHLAVPGTVPGPISRLEAICSHEACRLAVHGPVYGPINHPRAVCSHGTCHVAVHGPIRGPVCSHGTCLPAIHGPIPEPCPVLAPLALPDQGHCSCVGTSVASLTLPDPTRSSSV